MGRQVRVELPSGKPYFIDLLFFHRKLKCMVAMELKVTEFDPEFAGKSSFYLTALDEQVKQPDEQPSVGIIIVKNKDRIEVEYALRSVSNPLVVATYTYTELSTEIQKLLPSDEELKIVTEIEEVFEDVSNDEH
jgi:YhcG PDDEXK nuclease domain